MMLYCRLFCVNLCLLMGICGLVHGFLLVKSKTENLSPRRRLPLFGIRSTVTVHARSYVKLYGTAQNDMSANKRFADLQTDSMKRSSNPSRRKMGPPQRKRNAPIEETNKPLTGRVSVYCVGASIDLQALRAHIFRRGFNAMKDDGKAELTLARLAEDSLVDNEVLHVSNAPLFLTSNYNRLPTPWANSNSIWQQADSKKPGETSVPSVVSDRSKDSQLEVVEEDMHSLKPISEDWGQLPWKTKEMLIMSTQDIFYFEYGCVVFWGLTSLEEKAALNELEAFTQQPVSPVELENSFDTMEFVFDRSANPQRPIRFDRMKLRSLRVEEKLALSYAMAQSSKLFVFEQKVLQSVERTRYLPKELAEQGKISCSKKDLNRLIGQLFVEQTEVNLFSSILDTPDFLWDDDEYFPIYDYTRSYLEVDDRVQLLNSRLSVIRELLDVLTAQVADNNSARLEWIVIWLIAIEIVMGIASGPLFAGKRVVAALLVPSAILFYKKYGQSD
ncbi:hypothetical protein EON65_19600 [archaeon]|nr:MAG: hypothetical protein EON65_19600 [archaeon]